MAFSTPAELKHLYQVSAEDLAAVKRLGEAVLPRLDDQIEQFYVWLRELPEYEEFLSDDSTLKRVSSAQFKYWERFYDGVVDDEYVQGRRRVGETHARIGLPLDTYFAAMSMSLELHSQCIPQEDDGSTLRATAKLMHLDTGLVVEAYNEVISTQLAAQSTALLKMSTPVTQVWDGISMMPIVGIIDSKRAQDIMNAILRSIAESKANHFILDISGVAVVDTAVANHLIKITRATALMGCECIISGISSAIAQTIVELGIDVGTVRTTAALKDALAMVFQAQGVSLEKVASA
jgi:rsbT co-antagonist protein RsbR